MLNRQSAITEVKQIKPRTDGVITEGDLFYSSMSDAPKGCTRYALWLRTAACSLTGGAGASVNARGKT